LEVLEPTGHERLRNAIVRALPALALNVVQKDRDPVDLATDGRFQTGLVAIDVLETVLRSGLNRDDDDLIGIDAVLARPYLPVGTDNNIELVLTERLEFTTANSSNIDIIVSSNRSPEFFRAPCWSSRKSIVIPMEIVKLYVTVRMSCRVG
jgi:hypothetical protein